MGKHKSYVCDLINYVSPVIKITRGKRVVAGDEQKQIIEFFCFFFKLPNKERKENKFT